MTNELKPCNCGNSYLHYEYIENERLKVYCDICKSWTDISDKYKNAFNTWNNRPEEEKYKKENEILTKALGHMIYIITDGGWGISQNIKDINLLNHMNNIYLEASGGLEKWSEEKAKERKHNDQ